MQTKWQISNPDPDLINAIQNRTGCHRATAAVLANRSLTANSQIENFFNPALSSLPEPEQLPDLEVACRRIHRALAEHEQILVIGDYDVDGITSTALLANFLENAGAKVAYHLPHRIKEGYDFQPVHVTQVAVPRKTGLIITVDCGISSVEAVETASRFGIDTVITDHHSFNGDLPRALAIINPKRQAPENPLYQLAGVGVAFYLAIGLRKHLRQQQWWSRQPEPNLKDLCDLVALGTVADMVSLQGVNRVLVKTGLELINRNPRPGIAQLMAASGIEPGRVNSEDISFKLAPRINAAGRVAHPAAAMALLRATATDKALHAAENLCALNARRQTMEQQILDDVDRRLERHPFLADGQCLLMAGDRWHPGIIGIVAAKLANRFFKPVVIIGVENGIGKGSARSIPGIDIYQVLRKCTPYLERFGGHSMAAGLTVSSANIGIFQAALEKAVADICSSGNPKPVIKVDCELNFDDITPGLVDELEALQPFGPDNPAPVFMTRQVVATECVTIGQKHLKMRLRQAARTSRVVEAIRFNSEIINRRSFTLEKIAYRLQRRHYNGKAYVQAVIENSL